MNCLIARRESPFTDRVVAMLPPAARGTTYKTTTVTVYAVIDDALSPDLPLGVELELYVRREDAERFIEQVRRDDSEMAAKLRIEERELDAGGLN